MDLRFTRRFLLDMSQRSALQDTVIDDPITLFNTIIHEQEQDCYSSSDEDDDDDRHSGGTGTGSGPLSYDDDEDDYSHSDSYDAPALPPLGLRPITQFPPQPLRSIKPPMQNNCRDEEVHSRKAPVRMFKCGKCVSVFSSQKSLTVHKLQRHGGVRNGGTASTTTNNRAPMLNGGRQNGNVRDYCQQPEEVSHEFYDEDLLLAGMDPNDILKCTYCPRQFPNPSTLKVHMNTHTRERPYECQYCQKRFFQSSHLTVHIRTHTGEKPYKCQFCKNAFNSPSNCRVHERTHMKGNEIYQCEECNIGFLHKSRLERHLRSRKHVHPGGIVPRSSH